MKKKTYSLLSCGDRDIFEQGLSQYAYPFLNIWTHYTTRTLGITFFFVYLSNNTKQVFLRHKHTSDLLPKNFRGGASSTRRAVACRDVAADSCVGDGVTWPRQRALEGTAQVVKGPGYDDIVVETNQRGHTQHPNSNTYNHTEKNKKKHTFG